MRTVYALATTVLLVIAGTSAGHAYAFEPESQSVATNFGQPVAPEVDYVAEVCNAPEAFDLALITMDLLPPDGGIATSGPISVCLEIDG